MNIFSRCVFFNFFFDLEIRSTSRSCLSHQCPHHNYTLTIYQPPSVTITITSPITTKSLPTRHDHRYISTTTTTRTTPLVRARVCVCVCVCSILPCICVWGWGEVGGWVKKQVCVCSVWLAVGVVYGESDKCLRRCEEE